MIKKWLPTKFLLMVTLLLWVAIEPLHLSSHDKQHPPSCEICFQLQHQSIEFVNTEIFGEFVEIHWVLIPLNYQFDISNFIATFYDLRGPPISFS